MDGLVNWEGSQTDDAERFSQNSNNDSDGKNLKSFDVYLKRKEVRSAAKKAAKKKATNISV